MKSAKLIPQFFTANEVARAAGYSRRAIQFAVARGELEPDAECVFDKRELQALFKGDRIERIKQIMGSAHKIQ